MTATRVLRVVGSVALWLAAVIGVLTCGVWVATSAEWIKPLIVVSGSMEPEIPTGALIVDTRLAVEQLSPGDVVTVYSDLARNLVTHRVESIEYVDRAATLILRGDANPTADPEPYVVDSEVWRVALVVPGLGEFIADVSRPGVVVPAMIGIGALLGLSLLREPDADATNADEEEDQPAEHEPDHDAPGDTEGEGARGAPRTTAGVS